jgi:glycosyltransferase involved in cell wall biosynthesis
MKINIAAAHRFHLLDLSRELKRNGHDVKFYSYVPTKRCVKLGELERSDCRFLWFALPFLILKKIFKNNPYITKYQHWTMDLYLRLFMRPCDIYIALGVIYKESFITAKKKFRALSILEWGSKHIDEQQRILRAIPGTRTNIEYFNKRARESYSIVDYIAIPSEHVKESFLLYGCPEAKLLVNPYGTSLSRFYPTNKPSEDAYDVIMVGQWSYQKGCDLIIEACRKLKVRFLHVGWIADVKFPADKNFTHINSVDETQLVKYYSQAKVFVLPSRQDGFGMVLSQALACGLLIVCSKDTGGSDLRNFLDNKKWIIEMPETTVECLAECIQKALTLADTQPEGKRNYAGKAIEQLTWEAYGKRYNENIFKIYGK